MLAEEFCYVVVLFKCLRSPLQASTPKQSGLTWNMVSVTGYSEGLYKKSLEGVYQNLALIHFEFCHQQFTY